MADIVAASTSYTDVNSAVASASNGDRVLVPAGSSTWTSELTITGKYLSLVGAGIGLTNITDEVVRTNGLPRMFDWETVNGGPSRITGFSFFGGTQVDNFNKGNMRIGGVSHQFRMDHNAFNPTLSNSCVHFEGDVRGVFDHNACNASNGGFLVYVHHHAWNGVGGYGDNSYAVAHSIGTIDALFFEDNTFTNDQATIVRTYAVDGWSGGRVVYRYNTFTNCTWANHGTETSGRPRSQRQWEVYSNTFTLNLQTGNFPSMIGVRGGSGVIANNVATVTNGTMNAVADGNNLRNDPAHPVYYPFGWAGSVTPVSITRSGTAATITFTDRYGLASFHGFDGPDYYVEIVGADQSQYNGIFPVASRTASTVTYTMASDPGATATGTITVRSPWDGNTDVRGYRALDQIGAGSGTLISGDVPVPTGDLNQVLEPAYIWGNTLNGSASNFLIAPPNSQIVIELNRDYYNSARPGWVPFTYPHPFVESVNVGSGGCLQQTAMVM